MQLRGAKICRGQFCDTVTHLLICSPIIGIQQPMDVGTSPHSFTREEVYATLEARANGVVQVGMCLYLFRNS